MKIKNILILIILLQMLATNAHAELTNFSTEYISNPNVNTSTTKNLLIQPEEMSDAEFNAQKIAHPEFTAYDDYIIKNLTSQKMIAQLTSTFVRAQESFLKSEINQIKDQWLDVITFAYKADWASAQRQMIQIAYLRLAQIADSNNKTNQYISDALSFDPSFVPDETMFPPPILDQYFSLKSKLRRITISTDAFKGFSKLLVNGVLYSLQDKNEISLLPGTKRFTFASATFNPINRVFDTLNLTHFRPQRRLVELPAIQPNEKPNKEYALNKIKNYSDLQNSSTIELTPDLKTKAFYKKPAFWIGTSIIAGVLLLRDHHNDKSSRTSSHREGF